MTSPARVAPVNVRTDNAVTLTHADAQAVIRLIQEHGRGQWDHYRKTKSAVVQSACHRDAAECNRLADIMTRALWTWKLEQPSGVQS